MIYAVGSFGALSDLYIRTPEQWDLVFNSMCTGGKFNVLYMCTGVLYMIVIRESYLVSKRATDY